jgi:nitrogen-specific signal transduction histidine kinase
MKAEFKKSNDLDVFLIFRWLVLLSIILIAGYATEELPKIGVIYIIAFLYFAFNITLRIWKPELLKKQLTLFSLFLFDIFVVSAVFYLTGSISSDYYIFYFLTIMMASISSGIGASIAITIASVGIYIWLVQQRDGFSFEDPVFLLKIIFLLLTAFISSLWNRIMKERIETVKRSEEQEKKNIQQFYREVISSINAGIAVFEDVDGETAMRLINPKAQELAKGDTKIISILQECVKECGNPHKSSHMVKIENGRYWGINLSFFEDSKKNKQGAIVVFNDITERKRMEREMQRSERINRLGKLTLQIAHDLRNPLGTVSGLAQLLTMSSKDKKGKKYGKEILKTTNIINELIGDMLDFSKDQELNFEEFDYVSFMHEVVDNFKKSENIKEKKAEIKFKYDKGDYGIVADKEKLRRVFGNLINNACDALNEGGKIDINLSEKKGTIATKVIDNGSGIPESKKDEIFEPFVTGKQSGTGLGLSIVQRIVSSHKGKIFVDSKENEGTVFTVELPKKGGKNG